MRELLVATKNPGKFREIEEALGNGQLSMIDDQLAIRKDGAGSNFFKLVFLRDAMAERVRADFDDSDFVEDGATFAENAEKKARYYYEKFGGKFDFVLGEDSGILVDALAGELGVQTRRWGAGHDASDEQWIEYFLRRMEGVPVAERGAKFVCHACVVGNYQFSIINDQLGKGRERESEQLLVKHFSGETLGVITAGLEAPITAGIPLSSCFRPAGFAQVYAALSTEEKNRISHRGKAMTGVRKFLAGN